MISGKDTQTRAERLRLVRKLELAHRGTELLRSKEEALQRERVRLEAHVARTEQAWNERCDNAAEALLRSRTLGASGELQSIIDRTPGSAQVNPHWETSMGIVYPGVVDAATGPTPTVTSTAALRPAIDCYEAALLAAAGHGATTAALHRLTAELGKTRRRRRAIEQRLLHSLESTLHDLDLHLDEQDREEALRVHTATRRRETGRRASRQDERSRS